MNSKKWIIGGLELIAGTALGLFAKEYSPAIFDYIANHPVAQNGVAYGLRELSSWVAPSIPVALSAFYLTRGGVDLYNSFKKEEKPLVNEFES